MSDWVAIYTGLKDELKLGSWDDVPKDHWPELARRCGTAEFADIQQRLDNLDAELNEIPEWDGDSKDDVWKARELFETLLKLKPKP